MTIRFILGICAAALLLITGGCSDSGGEEGPLVLAAASLNDALSEAADVWTADGHARPILSFAATSALARQVESGAQADLFISADETWMNALSDKGLIRNTTRTSFLTNTLVLIAPADSSLSLSISPGMALAQTLGSERLAIANPDSVPAGRYAKQALSRLNVWKSLESKVVPAENVRVALALVARKEAALGIVYLTDARFEPGVRIVGSFPPDSHVRITYPMAQLKTSQNRETNDFRHFLLSEKGRAIFRKYGFEAGPDT